jgi:hypothetical protein
LFGLDLIDKLHQVIYCPVLGKIKEMTIEHKQQILFEFDSNMKAIENK